MSAFLRVENLTHIYPGKIKALESINLEIGEGEVVAVLGRNGSGKTTLVKHFNGLLKPTKGNVWIGDMNAKKHSVAKLSAKVGYVFQNSNHQTFLPSVEQELRYGCENIGLDEETIQERVERVTELFQLEDILETNPFDLNSTQRKEVGMASILAIEPKVIVLDEPTTGQDHAGSERIKEVITMLKEQGHIVILVTHDMQLVGELDCRVVVISNGKKLADGAAREVFKDKAMLKEASLEPPQVMTLAEQLTSFGVNDHVLTVEEMIKEYKRVKKLDINKQLQTS
ncbi:energy-coupling factor ABC transporter ATP-binding protein [Aquibacillus albus]|uniref:Energy-coupling factor transport system ATP-binding protein n=1 Tax=Aquibacillus albus TaxID=1168171 RepID=A0ABS2MXW6_9BACI|nr:energy-coupling factor ABC transporter ATP-binding protein [Aquibacillus albus]MBM7570722.1 energy-coupling factor transport system ATP-binding protein [Aquibacillus albus]